MQRVSGMLAAVSLGLLVAGPALGAEKLRIAVEDAAAPWSSWDGTGFANDLVVAAFRAGGVEVELTVVPCERGRGALQHKLVDQGPLLGGLIRHRLSGHDPVPPVVGHPDRAGSQVSPRASACRGAAERRQRGVAGRARVAAAWRRLRGPAVARAAAPPVRDV